MPKQDEKEKKRKNSKTKPAIIIVVVLVAALVIIGVIINARISENQFCRNWHANLQEKSAELEANIWATESDYAIYNADVDEYNRQCYY